MKFILKDLIFCVITLVIIIMILRYLGGILQQNLLSSKFSTLLLFPGTVIHELSHLIVSIIFGLKITKVRLFNFDYQETGCLGEVDFAYHPFSFKDCLGAGLSGIAPIFGIALTDILIYFKMFPENVNKIIFDLTNHNVLNLVFQIFDVHNLFKLVIFLIISLLLGSGLTISDEDIQNTLRNIVQVISFIGIIIVILLITNHFNDLIIFFDVFVGFLIFLTITTIFDIFIMKYLLNKIS